MTAQPNNVVEMSQWRGSPAMDMNPFQFQQWTELLKKRTGISLPETRRSFLLTSLNIRMYELGIENYQAYYNYLLSGHEGNIEWETLVDRLTVHETRFYRDQHALQLIRDEYLVHLEQAATRQTINVWSVGCATGEESYSLAISLDDYLSEHEKKYYYAITGSDISSAAIGTARKGIYKLNRLTNLPEGLLDKYLQQVDENSYQVSDSIRQRVCFNQVNLLDLENTKVGMMDIIFCQNVLIYFQREQRVKILNSLVQHLKTGGLIILGAGEIHGWKHPDMVPVKYESTLAFRRIATQESKA